MNHDAVEASSKNLKVSKTFDAIDVGHYLGYSADDGVALCLSVDVQWRRNEFESGERGTGPPQRIYFGRAPPLFGS